MNIAWDQILENLTTDAILQRVGEVDPLSLLNNPYMVVGALVLLGALAFLQMFRTLAVIVGGYVLWYAVVYTLPHGELEGQLGNLASFIGICAAVMAVWVYVFFIREG
ncbi:hypothetical protein G3N55_03495 [Dissulfurirhabdus thermomarina]|uniref:Uncharacterized protein n=1 Tax=Dissulfurirhabdus thermomarina TaxID=1765737 RepID=A0A6N9TKV9_DISTH|nr:hypothetical protein [Dissulfurirhabdus thermomarina]NDY41912.1 hypothetical protein [Dissulfurirhabdus thermomarina]NMX23919.1 hypothetical protein [Dissulfurirhabdus thermomarina]